MNKSIMTKKQEQLFFRYYGPINKKKVDEHLISSYLGTAVWSLDRLNKIDHGKLSQELFESKSKEKQLYDRQIKKLKETLKEKN